MQTTISINGTETTITLTPAQVAQITEASKPKLFYEVDGYKVHPNQSGAIAIVKKHGRYRRTKEAAEMDFKRQTRMMRLSALAWEVGECKEFVKGERNFYVFFVEGKFEVSSILYSFCPEQIYMTEETATKVCEMLNSGEYSLDVD